MASGARWPAAGWGCPAPGPRQPPYQPTCGPGSRDASGAGFAANPSSQPAPQNRMARAAKPHCRSGRCGSARGAQRRRNPAYHPFRRRQFKLLLRFFFTELTCSNSSSVLVRALLSTDGSTAADQFLPRQEASKITGSKSLLLALLVRP